MQRRGTDLLIPLQTFWNKAGSKFIPVPSLARATVGTYLFFRKVHHGETEL